MFFRRGRPRVETLKVVIVGAGEVGYHIAHRLSDEHKQVVVIDQRPDRLQRLEETMDVQTVLGSGASPTVLREAGAGDASIFLAVTDSDETNIMACLFANAIAPKATKLARIRNEEYSAYPELLGGASLNISMLVNPEVEIVRTIDRLLTLPGAVEYGEFAERRIRMVGMKVDDGPLLDRPLLNFRQIIGDDGIMVGAIARDNTLIVPSGNDTIRHGDVVYFVYRPASQRNLLHGLNRTRGFINSACIFGGGNIGVRLARLFEAKGITVKLIDSSGERCLKIAELLDKTLVLHGDATDRSLLEEEHIPAMDAFVAVTGDEESNILSCLLAKSLGIKETVARVNKPEYLPLVESIGIQHSVSPRHSAVNSILQYIRQGKVLSSVSVGGEAAEVLEALVPEDSALAGCAVSALGLPRGALLMAVLRGEDAFIPTGRTVIETGDRIVLLVLRDTITSVEAVLTRKQDKRP